MEDLSLHILDIVENSIRAQARNIEIAIIENPAAGTLTVRITDDGKGMDEEASSRAFDPFYSTKDGKRVGLGLALLAQSAEQTGGKASMTSTPGAGTSITAEFATAHPDMVPMGDILETTSVLLAANPTLRFVLRYEVGAESICFDSADCSDTM